MTTPVQADLFTELEVRGSVSDDPRANTMGKSHAQPQRTELAGAMAVWPRTGTQRMAVLRAVCEAADGLTDAELSEQTGIFLTSELPRRGELVTGGWVEDSGRQRPTGHGGDGIVWVSTPKARARATREGWVTP